jgi:hypothetical protein
VPCIVEPQGGSGSSPGSLIRFSIKRISWRDKGGLVACQPWEYEFFFHTGARWQNRIYSLEDVDGGM